MSVKIEDQICQNCTHFLEDPYGKCRRYPPTTDRVWPMVYAHDWCGEWAGDIPDSQQFRYAPVGPDIRTQAEIDAWVEAARGTNPE